MTKNEKSAILSAKAVAYFSGFGGIEIKSIEYGIEDYVLFVVNAWYGEKSAHKARICYNAGGKPYFRAFNTRIYFGDCVRI